jgi:hypothetical protein
VIATQKSDPIFEIGMNPVSCGLLDASEKTEYLYLGSGN